MKELVAFGVLLLYVFGLAKMWVAGFVWWTIIGAFIPWIPLIYAMSVLIERFGL